MRWKISQTCEVTEVQVGIRQRRDCDDGAENEQNERYFTKKEPQKKHLGVAKNARCMMQTHLRLQLRYLGERRLLLIIISVRKRVHLPSIHHPLLLLVIGGQINHFCPKHAVARSG